MIKERHVQGWLEKGMAAFSSVYQVSQAMWAVMLVFRIGTKQVLMVVFFGRQRGARSPVLCSLSTPR